MTRDAPGEPREHRRLQQPLKIERHIVARVARRSRTADEQRAPALLVLTAILPVDDRHELEQLAMARVDEPVDVTPAETRGEAPQRPEWRG